MERFTLSANERIKNSKEITTLIREGQAFFLSPYKVYYRWEEMGPAKVRAAFAVPKKKFSQAVMRNKLKRLSREALRLQKNKLSELSLKQGKTLCLLFMYQRTSVSTYQEIQTAVAESIAALIKKHG